MGAPFFGSWVRFPRPDGGPAHLDIQDWLLLAVTSPRLGAGARPPRAAAGREILNWQMLGDGELAAGPDILESSPRGSWGCWEIGAVWKLHCPSGRNAMGLMGLG